MVMVHQSLPVIDIKIYASEVILSSTEYSLWLLRFKKKKKSLRQKSLAECELFLNEKKNIKGIRQWLWLRGCIDQGKAPCPPPPTLKW